MVTSADPDPLQWSVCDVFFCKPWGLMTLQREETIPRPVSCFSPSWTICRHFCSWWLPFEPCGGYLEAQPCEVTSKEVTFCLLEVTRREGGILTCLDSALTWQMLCNELGNKGRMWIFQICRITRFIFSFLDMHHSLSLTEIVLFKDCVPVDYSSPMPDWQNSIPILEVRPMLK